MTEFEKFKKFFKKYGVEFSSREWPNLPNCQFIDILGIKFEFEDSKFSYLYDRDYNITKGRTT